MPIVGVEKLVELQRSPENVRNICILAHVDHGKTSLTDSLIATNGIISPKLAGQIRYLDSRPDEQLRGITMESSAISLYFSMQTRVDENSTETKLSEHLINLIDSPGHVDFQFEVSTASRLCDGAVVLVDAAEGVGSQTTAVLRQAWTEKLKTILVINKMDRLVTELKMTPAEAYTHLRKLIEQVNAIVGGFVLGDIMEEDFRSRDKENNKGEGKGEGDSATVELDEEEDVYFAPEKNNVIFSSAINGWAFSIKQFAHLWSKKTKMSRSVLEKTLWGDYYLDMKANKVMTAKQMRNSKRSLKQMFVQLILEPIWSVYEIVGTEGALSEAQMNKLKAISPNLTPNMLRTADRSALTKAVFASWLPLSTALLVTVTQQLPSPKAAQEVRAPSILAEVPAPRSLNPELKEAVLKFETQPGKPVVAYVSKMVAMLESELLSNRRQGSKTMTAEEARELARKKRAEFAKLQAADVDGLASTLETTFITETPEIESKPVEEVNDPEHLIGYARLYSGTLSVGDSIYSIPPKYSPDDPSSPRPIPVTIKQLYILMGRSMEPISSVPAGVIVGIEGLEGAVLKSGTLCSSPENAINLAGLSGSVKPIVRVALEPVNPVDLDKMVNGLKLLVQADPCAQYELLDSGEYVICCAGELHLERCLKDLTERFARCEIQQGEPIVPFRETIVPVAPDTAAKENRGTVLLDGSLEGLRISVKPLPKEITDFLARHTRVIKRFLDKDSSKEDVAGVVEPAAEAAASGDIKAAAEAAAAHAGTDQLDAAEQVDDCSRPEFKKRYEAAVASVSDKDLSASGWSRAQLEGSRVASFGPGRVGPNVLVDMTSSGALPRSLLLSDSGADTPALHPLRDQIVYGFQLALAQGPLCHEPVQGVAVVLEDGDSNGDGSADEAGSVAGSGVNAGVNAIRTVRDGVHAGFLEYSPRLLLATFGLQVQTTTDVLGRVYGVVTRRQGQVLDEFMAEGQASTASLFTVVAAVPVIAAFGIVEEIRKRSSGAAAAQLSFVGFRMLDQDPFWVPTTAEEMEDLGEFAERENVAKRYMDQVRARKGLFVEGRKLVENAEKQKTLKR